MIVVALGANIPGPFGPPLEGLDACICIMANWGINVAAVSPWYRSEALKIPVSSSGNARKAQPDFVNGVAAIESALPPETLLSRLHGIEARYGRERRERWGDRPLDLDLIDYDGLITRQWWPAARGWGNASQAGQEAGKAGEALCLPHPRAHERAFVLKPLQDIAPSWRHPVYGSDCAALLAGLEDTLSCERL